jgi:photosystem II stability/assembly factor-like uncharacterized protein
MTITSRTRRFRRTCGAIGAVVTLGSVSTIANANGRYAASQQLVVDPGDPNRLWLRATYGVLTSPDGGKTWEWLCEDGMGVASTEDPMLGVTADGKVFAASLEGLLSTSDHGCNWTRSADVGKRIATDLDVESDGHHVLVLTSLREPTGNYDVVVFRSDDAATHFTALGPAISEDVIPITIDAAPSDPKRIYVSGAFYPYAAAADASAFLGDAALNPADAPAVLFRSQDSGTTWERKVIQGASATNLPFIAAVDPTNPDVLYVRVMGAVPASGTVQSWLLYSNDAGDTFREIYRANADMLGFALADAGHTVRLGMGDSHESSRPVDPNAIGILTGSPPDFAFSRTFSGQVSCLTSSSAGLYVCGGHDSDGWELGLFGADGGSQKAVFDFRGARGPLSCTVTSFTALQCNNQWPSVCSQIGKSCAPITTTEDAGVTHHASPPAKGGGGCACTTPGSADTHGESGLEALAALGVIGLSGARGRARGHSCTKSRST